MPLPPGTLIGRYELLESIAAGRLSEVYKARDTSIGRTVAVKVLAASLSEDPTWLKRFELEARAAGQLDHPNILSIHDVGVHERRPYLVSEWLDGETLRQRLAVAPMPWRKAVASALQVAQGIAAAHEKGIVHRDLKPENLFVTRDGRIKILDLGLARTLPAPMLDPSDPESPTLATVTQPGTVLGTVGYMSPEQVRGQPADARSDIFSFGAILYEMATGGRAFLAGSPIETLMAILREDPRPIPDSVEAPSALVSVIRRCVEKNPEERFQSARDVSYALEDLLARRHRDPSSAPSGRSAKGGKRRSTSGRSSRTTRDKGSAAEDSCFRLVLSDREVILRSGENVIGRGRGATVRIPSDSISRRHARILIRGEEATLEDLDSKNGTFLRGERIESPSSLRPGDTIRLGSVSMTLKILPATGTTETQSKT